MCGVPAPFIFIASERIDALSQGIVGNTGLQTSGLTTNTPGTASLQYKQLVPSRRG